MFSVILEVYEVLFDVHISVFVFLVFDPNFIQTHNLIMHVDVCNLGRGS